jgi:hypothetical protein
VLISSESDVIEISDELHAFKKYLPDITILVTCEIFITPWSWYPYKWFNKGQYRGMDVVECWLHWELTAHLHGRSEHVTRDDENGWGLDDRTWEKGNVLIKLYIYLKNTTEIEEAFLVRNTKWKIITTQIVNDLKQLERCQFSLSTWPYFRLITTLIFWYRVTLLVQWKSVTDTTFLRSDRNEDVINSFPYNLNSCPVACRHFNDASVYSQISVIFYLLWFFAPQT